MKNEKKKNRGKKIGKIKNEKRERGRERKIKTFSRVAGVAGGKGTPL